MARGLASLISMFGAGAQGYMQGQRMVEDRDRRARLDARDEEIYQRDKDKYDKAQALDADISGAMADRQLETVNPPEMTNADLSMLPAQTTQYKVGDQTFDDEGKAKAALQGMNSKAAKYQRAAQAAALHGAAGVDKAAQYDNFAKQALSEGSDQILSAISSSAPSLADVKKNGGMVAGTVGQQAADVFNQTGGRWKVSPDTQVQHFVDKDAAGREFVNSRVIGADGKPVVEDVHHMGLMLQDYKTRAEAERANMQAAQKGQELDLQGKRDAVMADHYKAEAANSQALRGIQAGQLALAQKKDAREEKLFKNQTPEGQIELAETAIGRKLSDTEKKQVLGFGKNKATDEAFLNDLTKEYQKNNPTATAQQIAQYRADQQDSFTKAAGNQQALSAVKAEFAKHKPGSPEYAQTWNDAKTDLGMTDDQLVKLGYKPPPQMVANPVANPTGQAARGTGRMQSTATVVGQPVDVRNDPALAALNDGIAKLAGKNDPASVQQLMDLGTAKNARIEQLRANYGSMAQLVTE